MRKHLTYYRKPAVQADKLYPGQNFLARRATEEHLARIPEDISHSLAECLRDLDEVQSLEGLLGIYNATRVCGIFSRPPLAELVRDVRAAALRRFDELAPSFDHVHAVANAVVDSHDAPRMEPRPDPAEYASWPDERIREHLLDLAADAIGNEIPREEFARRYDALRAVYRSASLPELHTHQRLRKGDERWRIREDYIRAATVPGTRISYRRGNRHVQELWLAIRTHKWPTEGRADI